MNSLCALSLMDWRFALELASEPSVRGQSFDQRLPTRWGHTRWMLKWVLSPNHRAWVIWTGPRHLPLGGGYIGGQAGIVRVSREHDIRVVIGIAVKELYRGLGIGRAAIEDATRLAIERWGLPVHAEIKPENLTSIRVFEAAGYNGLRVGDTVIMAYLP